MPPASTATRHLPSAPPPALRLLERRARALPRPPSAPPDAAPRPGWLRWLFERR